MKPRLALALLVLLPPLAASCGLQKPLDRPPPMFGAERAKYDAEHAHQKADEDAAKNKIKPPGGDIPPPPSPYAPIAPGRMAPPPAPSQMVPETPSVSGPLAQPAQ